MEKDFKISLIIAAYNEEKYIGDCLDSAIKNSHGKFFEIIVVDNASTDNTRAEVLKRPNVKVIYEEKKGVTRARERGYLEAKGDLLAFVDADTAIPEGWVDKIISEFTKNQNTVAMSGPYVYYDIPKYQQFLVKLYWYLATLVYFIVGYMANAGNLVIRKETLIKMNGFDTNIEFYGDDADTVRRASKFGRVKFNLDFIMFTSGRRFFGQGLLKTAGFYVLNFFSEVFLHKPLTNRGNDIR